MFGTTCYIRKNMVQNGPNSNIRGESKGTFKAIKSFEFAFILLIDEVLGTIDILCKFLKLVSRCFEYIKISVVYSRNFKLFIS